MPGKIEGIERCVFGEPFFFPLHIRETESGFEYPVRLIAPYIKEDKGVLEEVK